MGTFGRYSLVCESLACFLHQSEVSKATLLIYNQHPAPLRFDHPRVRVVNEELAPAPLRQIRRGCSTWPIHPRASTTEDSVYG